MLFFSYFNVEMNMYKVINLLEEIYERLDDSPDFRRNLEIYNGNFKSDVISDKML